MSIHCQPGFRARASLLGMISLALCMLYGMEVGSPEVLQFQTPPMPSTEGT